MPSLFDNAMGAALAVLDDVFGEAFVLEPRSGAVGPSGYADPNARKVVSPTRAPIEFTGTWIAPGAEVHVRGRAMDLNTTRAVATETPMIDIDVTALPQEAFRGDIIQRVKDGRRYEVSKQVPADSGRAWIHVVGTIKSEGTR